MNECLEQASCQRPHVVILGAGASLAAFPNGDKHGSKLPLMNNLVDVIGLRDLLLKESIVCENENFEGTYCALYEDPKNTLLLKKIEEKIEQYFTSLQIPDEPTLYDHLLLSLREKDRIATFNWDPLLWDAAQRCNQITNGMIPNILFLHGNVAIAIDHNNRQKVDVRSVDPKRNMGEKSKLLYPIKTKGYKSDKFIKNEWDTLQHYLKQAYRLTIFGYSAPSTDAEAIDLLKEAWGTRELKEIDIIDIKEEATLRDIWEEFICREHWEPYQSFYETDLALFPRRSCEKLWQEKMMCEFLTPPQQSPLLDKDFEELREYISGIN